LSDQLLHSLGQRKIGTMRSAQARFRSSFVLRITSLLMLAAMLTFITAHRLALLPIDHLT